MTKLILSLALVGTSSFAGTYRCAETPEVALAKGRLQYAAFITEGSRITDKRIVRDHDGALNVTVTILSRDPEKGGRFEADSARPAFDSVAWTEDVMFQINRWKKNGFQFALYMDELNESSIKIKGIRGWINVNCAYYEKE